MVEPTIHVRGGVCIYDTSKVPNNFPIKISVISHEITPNKHHFGMDSMVREMFHNVLQSKCVITFRV